MAGLVGLMACGGGAAPVTSDASAPVDAAVGPPVDAAPLVDAAPAVDPTAYMFDGTVIRDLALEIPPASWDAINAEAGVALDDPHDLSTWWSICQYQLWPRSYYAGNLIFEGERFDGVGIHVKGGCRSSRLLTQKAALAINLEWDDPAVPGCPAERRLHGLKKLVLNNMVEDPTYIREALGYGLLRAMDVPAPRTSYVRLTINGEYVGLYLLVEASTRGYYKRWFGERDGMAYEVGHPYCPVEPGYVGAGGCFEQEFHADACYTPDADDDPRDWTLLEQLAADIQALPTGAAFDPAFAALFDRERYLGARAASVAIHHFDSMFWNTENNYSVYHHPPDGRWTVMQQGLDTSMSRLFVPDPITWTTVNGIDARCDGSATCRARYVERIEEALQIFESPAFADEATRLHDLLWPDIVADPRRQYVDAPGIETDADFLAAYQDLRAWMSTWPARVRADVAAGAAAALR